MSSRPTLLGLAAALALACTPALAQPVQRDHRAPAPVPRDHRVPPPPPHPVPVAVMMPTSAPPPPQAEHPAPRAGFVWIGGRWDWKANKWAWVPGHWERPRAGKKWREGRWEQRGTQWAWVDGQWVAGSEPAVATVPPPPPPGAPPIATAPPPPPPGPEVRDHRHHEWKLDRPYVSSFFPQKGRPGAEIHIVGGNFSRDITIIYNGKPVQASAVNPTQIQFYVPKRAATGLISLRRGDRDLAVGVYNVVTSGDPEADARRAELAREKAAQEAWAAHEKAVARDQAARQAAWDKQQQEWESSREQRRAQREAEIRAKWDAAFLADPDTQAELTLHAQRVAALERAKDIADLKNDGKLAVRVDVATSRENDRHDQRMAALKAAFASKGGHP